MAAAGVDFGHTSIVIAACKVYEISDCFLFPPFICQKISGSISLFIFLNMGK